MAKNFSIWMACALAVMKENISIIEGWYEKGEMVLVIEQTKAFKKHIDSFLEFLLERQKLQVWIFGTICISLF